MSHEFISITQGVIKFFQKALTSSLFTSLIKESVGI